MDLVKKPDTKSQIQHDPIRENVHHVNRNRLMVAGVWAGDGAAWEMTIKVVWDGETNQIALADRQLHWLDT